MLNDVEIVDVFLEDVSFKELEVIEIPIKIKVKKAEYDATVMYYGNRYEDIPVFCYGKQLSTIQQESVVFQLQNHVQWNKYWVEIAEFIEKYKVEMPMPEFDVIRSFIDRGDHLIIEFNCDAIAIDKDQICSVKFRKSEGTWKAAALTNSRSLYLGFIEKLIATLLKKSEPPIHI